MTRGREARERHPALPSGRPESLEPHFSSDLDSEFTETTPRPKLLATLGSKTACSLPFYISLPQRLGSLCPSLASLLPPRTTLVCCVGPPWQKSIAEPHRLRILLPPEFATSLSLRSLALTFSSSRLGASSGAGTIAMMCAMRMATVLALIVVAASTNTSVALPGYVGGRFFFLPVLLL